MTTALGFHQALPTIAPTIAQGSLIGNLSGNYLYAITFVNANGETTIGSSTSVSTLITGAAILTGIQIGSPNVTARKIYRTVAGGTSLLFLTTINDNTTTTYTDIIGDVSLGVAPPVVTTADSVAIMSGYFIFQDAIVYASNVITATITNQPIVATGVSVIGTCPPGAGIILMPIPQIGTDITIKNISVNACIISTSAGNTINNGATLSLGSNSAVNLVSSSSTNWQSF